MKTQYPHMFSPITIGGVTFKNRIWSAPAGAHLLYGKEGYPNDHVVAYYANKARGGSANITVSAQNMDIYQEYDNVHAHENIFDSENHRFWNHLTDAIHFYGAKASLELLGFSYHGRNYKGELVNYSVNGEEGTQILDKAAMESIASIYADAAENALKCGFDMILIHGGHGLILSQMLSPKFNTRTDEFGGCLANRAKFPIMILDAIRARVGKKLLIEYRISGSELGGDDCFTPDDCVAFLEMVQDKIDIAHISAGSFFTDTEHIMHPNNFLLPGHNTYLAEYVKKSGKIHIPILTLGAYQQPKDIEAALAAGKADIVAMARGTIADAALVNKSRKGKEDEIIPCIKCFHCLEYSKPSTKAFACSVNPTVGRENQLKDLIPETTTPKKVVIIGGGPSGMEAAIIAAKRGHDVTIFEKADRLGGKLVFSEQVSFKYDLAKFMNYQINLVKKLGIKVVLNTEATPELIEAQKADWVLAAVGANAFVPPIPGTDGPNVMIAEECYKHIDEIGERVVLIGGGEVGCETALALAEKGKKVSIIEMLPELCPETFHLTRGVMLGKMEKCVDMYTGARCTGITTEGVSFVDKDGNEQFVPCDVVVMSSGMRPRQDLAESFRMTAPDFMPIGDCVIAKNVRTATRMAFDAATRI